MKMKFAWICFIKCVPNFTSDELIVIIKFQGLVTTKVEKSDFTGNCKLVVAALDSETIFGSRMYTKKYATILHRIKI